MNRYSIYNFIFTKLRVVGQHLYKHSVTSFHFFSNDSGKIFFWREIKHACEEAETAQNEKCKKLHFQDNTFF